MYVVEAFTFTQLPSCMYLRSVYAFKQLPAKLVTKSTPGQS